jgi:hypothetical protein
MHLFREMLNRSHGQLCAECYCLPEDVTPRQDPDLRSCGHLGRHFCTTSVAHNSGGNLLITAAHTLPGKSPWPVA